jgi:hypothetical protein
LERLESLLMRRRELKAVRKRLDRNAALNNNEARRYLGTLASLIMNNELIKKEMHKKEATR